MKKRVGILTSGGDCPGLNATIRGVAKDVTFNFRSSEVVTNPMTKKPTRSFKVWGDIKRKDFGVGVNEPAAMVGETVHVSADAECSPA